MTSGAPPDAPVPGGAQARWRWTSSRPALVGLAVAGLAVIVGAVPKDVTAQVERREVTVLLVALGAALAAAAVLASFRWRTYP